MSLYLDRNSKILGHVKLSAYRHRWGSTGKLEAHRIEIPKMSCINDSVNTVQSKKVAIEIQYEVGRDSVRIHVYK
jgi:hypothetical protein